MTIRARVDGTLQEVRFKEGQDVTAGDVLAVIDPRPFQATLDQAVANKAKERRSSPMPNSTLSASSICAILPRSRASIRKARSSRN